MSTFLENGCYIHTLGVGKYGNGQNVPVCKGLQMNRKGFMSALNLMQVTTVCRITTHQTLSYFQCQCALKATKKKQVSLQSWLD